MQPSNKVSDSFGPGLGEVPNQPQQTPQVTCQLKSPPKWLRRPCGATFGFGGKLVSFETVPGANGAPAKPAVYISSVVTEPELVSASNKLETSLKEGNLAEFCDAKLATLGNDGDKAKLWQFIGASFGENCDQQFIKLLGINLEELSGQLKALIKPAGESAVDEVAEKIDGLEVTEVSDEFEMIAAQAVAAPEQSPAITTLDREFSLTKDLGTDQGQLTAALLAGNIELAVDIAIKQNRYDICRIS